MVGIVMSVDSFTIVKSAVVSLPVMVLFCTGASTSLGHLEEESLSLRDLRFTV